MHFLHSLPFLSSSLLPSPLTPTLPIYSPIYPGDLVFFTFVCRSMCVSLRVLQRGP